jgi:hypothetical protein
MGIPAGFAAVGLVVFLAFFRDTNQIQTKPGLDIEEPNAGRGEV